MYPSRPVSSASGTFPPGFHPQAPAGTYTASLAPGDGSGELDTPAARLSARALAWTTFGVKSLAVLAGAYGLGAFVMAAYGFARDAKDLVIVGGFNMLGAAAIWWAVLGWAQEIGERSSLENLTVLRRAAWWCRGILFCLGWMALLKFALLFGAFLLVYLLPLALVGAAVVAVAYLPLMSIGRRKRR